MWFNTFGDLFSVTTFGESHGDYIGAVIDGIPGNLDFSETHLSEFLNLRHPGGELSSRRKEKDFPIIISGIFNGKTTGSPVCILLKNSNHSSDDYLHLKNIFRNGHGDYAWFKKFGNYDYRGGGRLSGRETASRSIGGYFAGRILNEMGISITSWVSSIGELNFELKDPEFIYKNPYRIPDPEKIPILEQFSKTLIDSEDSVGGTVSARICKINPGIGDPVAMKLDSLLAASIMSIGGVKGISFGMGFNSTEIKGTKYLENVENDGGITGGISDGNDINIKVAVKPVPTVGKKVTGKNFNGEEVEYISGGRHDFCIAPKISEVVRSMISITLLDAIYIQNKLKSEKTIGDLRTDISRLDLELISILQERMNTVEKIADLKKLSGIPVKDPSREEELWNFWLSEIERSDLDKSELKKIFDIIIKMSVEKQNSLF
ncbi:MAG: chorismate synthase [Deltaproteobacteria bacterium]|nr:chorismate synthase [Deltaproteobacteria bacterium]